MRGFLGLMRVFAVGCAYRGGRDEGWGCDELGRWDGSRCGIGIWSRSRLGRWGVSGVGIVQGELWIYPHSATPLIPTQSPYNTMSSPPTHYRIRTARHTPFSPPSPNLHSPYPPNIPCLHPTQLRYDNMWNVYGGVDLLGWGVGVGMVGRGQGVSGVG